MHIESHTERLMRNKYLGAILERAECVWIYGGDDSVEEYISYLRSVSKDVNVSIMNCNCDISIGKFDIIFPMLKDPDEYNDLFVQLTRQGVSELQIISPSLFYFPYLAEKNGFIYPLNTSEIQLPLLATIDTVNACNLDCATCIKPRWQENSERMDFELFKKILDKLQLMGIRQVELYNFTEPFLNPKIYDFMAEVKKRNLTLGISTNLSLPNIPNLKECVDLLENGDWFVITISGISQDIYEINHRRGKISNVIENIKNISKSAKRKIVRLRLLKFDYNIGEMLPAKKIADNFGLSFEWFPATGDPFNGEREKMWETYIRNGISYNDYDKASTPDGFFCPFIHSRNIVINHRGNVELCCRDVTRPYDLGSFLDQDISVIQMKRTFHPLCHSCVHYKEAVEEWNELRKYFPVQPNKVACLLEHAMHTIGMERRLSPRSYMANLKTDKEFITRVMERLYNR